MFLERRLREGASKATALEAFCHIFRVFRAMLFGRHFLCILRPLSVRRYIDCPLLLVGGEVKILGGLDYICWSLERV